MSGYRRTSSDPLGQKLDTGVKSMIVRDVSFQCLVCCKILKMQGLCISCLVLQTAAQLHWNRTRDLDRFALVRLRGDQVLLVEL